MVMDLMGWQSNSLRLSIKDSNHQHLVIGGMIKCGVTTVMPKNVVVSNNPTQTPPTSKFSPTVQLQNE